MGRTVTAMKPGAGLGTPEDIKKLIAEGKGSQVGSL